ncbi:MAG: pseudouridine synthase [Planctomycetia bacterium]|nr:pseudouridine synthase [Planctomycetia bacterium]
MKKTSSRTKTARNPGAVGRVKKFQSAGKKSTPAAKQAENRGKRGRKEEVTLFPGGFSFVQPISAKQEPPQRSGVKKRGTGAKKERPGKPTFPKRPSRGKPISETSPQPGERLQKVLAVAGFGSRRDCEELILAGRVMVDREVVTELGTRVLPEQTIHLDGEQVRRTRKKAYFALNKPANVICTNDDPSGRRRAIDLIHENVPGLFSVGRLDLHSEGLLLITNDGELANRLTHPRYGVPKVYRVRVSGKPTREELAQICKGVHLAEGLARVEEVRIHHVYRDGTTMLEITLREGRNREIRRILARIGHNVLDLVRVSIGPVKLGRIPIGMYRPLTNIEVRELKKSVNLD